MKVNIRDDFIGVFEEAASPELCEKYIKFFKDAEKCGITVDRQRSQGQSPLNMQDTSVGVLPNPQTQKFYDRHPQLSEVYLHAKEFNQILMDQALKLYCEKFMVSSYPDGHKKLMIQDTKLQRTRPGEGYHIWHHEYGIGPGRAHRRLLVYSLYLNDVVEGGETEFLYQRTRIKPKQGTLLIWPSQFTHIHRGNQPISGDKYLLTGWIEK